MAKDGMKKDSMGKDSMAKDGMKKDSMARRHGQGLDGRRTVKINGQGRHEEVSRQTLGRRAGLS